jgi:hypothetical protein
MQWLRQGKGEALADASLRAMGRFARRVGSFYESVGRTTLALLFTLPCTLGRLAGKDGTESQPAIYDPLCNAVHLDQKCKLQQHNLVYAASDTRRGQSGSELGICLGGFQAHPCWIVGLQ